MLIHVLLTHLLCSLIYLTKRNNRGIDNHSNRVSICLSVLNCNYHNHNRFLSPQSLNQSLTHTLTHSLTQSRNQNHLYIRFDYYLLIKNIRIFLQ